MAIVTTFTDLLAYSKAVTKEAREKLEAEPANVKNIRKAYALSGSTSDNKVMEAIARVLVGDPEFTLKFEVPMYSIFKIKGKEEEYETGEADPEGRPILGKRPKLYFKSSKEYAPNFDGFATDAEIERKFNTDEKFKAWIAKTYFIEA